MSGSAWWLTYVCALAVIVAVDAYLGPVAEYLNAYELLRHTLDLPWPSRSTSFISAQQELGKAAAPIAWLAWLVEGGLLTWCVRSLAGVAALPVSNGESQEVAGRPTPPISDRTAARPTRPT
ncbi:MAG: hypothetical protein OXR73_14955 [Myxococcales bacterium]|nr:hypothetical protein [Myxococcales bacterium]